MKDILTLLIFFGLILASLILVVMLFFGIKYAVRKQTVYVFLDSKEVYHGRLACVHTDWVGAQSFVYVSGGFLCMFPKEYYAGKNLVIKTDGGKLQ